MKHLLIAVLTSFIILLQSCSSNKAEQKNNNESKGTQNDKVTETPNNKVNGAIHITKADFLEKVWDFEMSPDKWEYKGDKPCIIDFYADWCGPCKIAAPILEELALEYGDEIYVYKIDTEKERELAQAFGINSIPAFLYCPKSGNPQMAAGIGRSPEETKQMFKKMIDEFLLSKK